MPWTSTCGWVLTTLTTTSLFFFTDPATTEIYTLSLHDALPISLISRCDSAAMVLDTSELLPEPETPVNTVSRRFESSTLMSLRLFTRAPCTRIRSWRSATCSAGAFVSVFLALLVAVLIVSPSCTRADQLVADHCCRQVAAC